MKSTVKFRSFKEDDSDFIYRIKNDESLNKMIVGKFRPFTHEDAKAWVRGCMNDNPTFKFWAICTNDEEDKIIGWTSLSEIDYDNKSACLHGMVIDREYQDGFAWIEAHQFIFAYVFEHLKLNRLYGESLVGHKASNLMEDIMFFVREGIKRQAYYKNGRYYDASFVGILANEYFEHKSNGDYETRAIIKRIGRLRKKQNK